jgi:hypothetical protein
VRGLVYPVVSCVPLWRHFGSLSTVFIVIWRNERTMLP